MRGKVSEGGVGDISWFVRGLDGGAVGLDWERRGRNGILRVSFGRGLGAFCMAIFVILGVVRVIFSCMLGCAVLGGIGSVEYRFDEGDFILSS